MEQLLKQSFLLKEGTTAEIYAPLFLLFPVF